MSEQTAAPAEVEAQQPPAEIDADKPLGPGGEKALKAEREARAAAEKQAAEFKAQLDKIEQANLSELEKAQRAAKDAQDQLEAANRQNLRSQVALAKGVPADLAPFLSGATEDELNAQADTLLARLNAPTTPRPDLTQGARGERAAGTPGDTFATFLDNQLGGKTAS